jgi:hypothetical protein
MNLPHKMGIDPRKPQNSALHKKAGALAAMPKPRPVQPTNAFSGLRAEVRATKVPREF